MPRFVCIDDDVPPQTIRVLQRACQRRNVEFKRLDATQFCYATSAPLEPGTLMYRPAVSEAAVWVESTIYADGVATFYSRNSAMTHTCLAPAAVLHAAGLSMPRTVYCASDDHDIVKSHVDYLGGFPIVVKLMGYEGGDGVILADRYEGLLPLLGFALSRNEPVSLIEYIPDAVHWRVVCVGDRAVAAYRNPRDPDDFRTSAPDDPAEYFRDVREDLADMAIRSTRAFDLEFGGADILERDDGRLYLLENNFPCYFADIDLVANLDVAGAMLEHLLEKSQRLTQRH